MTKKQILDTRLCNLRLVIKHSPLSPRIQQLYDELACVPQGSGPVDYYS